MKTRSIQIIVICLFMLCPMARANATTDYKINEQNKALRNTIYATLTGDADKAELYLSELMRYGSLLLLDHLNPSRDQWLEKNVWIIKAEKFREHLRARGISEPPHIATLYIEMMLNEVNIEILVDDLVRELVNNPLRYKLNFKQ